jgi:hypothetical protein
MSLLSLSALVLTVALQDDPLASYRKLDLTEKKGRPDEAWKQRIELEFKLIQQARPEPLRDALKDSNPNVRAFAARALGMLKDKTSAVAIAELAKSDPSEWVRCMSLQSLGWLKTGADAIQTCKNDRSRDVKYMAGVAERLVQDAEDHAKEILAAYRVGIQREELALARVGAAAPDFEGRTPDGGVFRLKDLLGKKVIVLAFQLADW